MREFLKGLDFDKETIDTIMAEHGKLLTSAKEDVTTEPTVIQSRSKKLTSRVEQAFGRR